MKRLLFILLLAFALLLTACGGGEEATEAPDMPASEAEEPAAEEPAGEEPAAGEAVELRFTFYADGNEAEVMQGLLDDFMAENPEITVILDVVPYATIGDDR